MPGDVKMDTKEQQTLEVSKDNVVEAQHAIPTDSDVSQRETFGKMNDVSVWRRTLITLGLAIGLFLAIMDTSIISTAIFTIAIEFNSLAGTIWVILAYTLVYLGFAVIFARMSDFVGRKHTVIGAFSIFLAFSIGGGFSQTLSQLIACRAFQGLGGAGLYSMALIMMIEICSPAMIAFISGIIGMTVSMSGVMGPLLGGLLTEYATWRWVFWINAPCAFFALLLFAIAWPKNSKAMHATRPFREFDYIGALLIIAASVLVVFGLQEAGTGAYPWSSALVVVTIVVGGLCWILLFIWEIYICKQHPSVAAIFPVSIMTNRALMAGIFSTALTGFIFFLLIISLPLRFQIVNQKSPAAAGIHLLPMLVASGFGSFIGGTLNKKDNRIFQTFTVASMLILLGSGLFTTLNSQLGIQAKEYGFQLILGFGVGMTFSSIAIMTSLETESKTHAAGQGIVAQMRIFGGSIGIAASNALFNEQSKSTLKGVLSPEQIASIQSSTKVIESLSPSQANLVRIAYARAFRDSSYVCIAISALFLVSALCTYQRNPKTRGQMRERIAAAAKSARERAAVQDAEDNGSNT